MCEPTSGYAFSRTVPVHVRKMGIGWIVRAKVLMWLELVHEYVDEQWVLDRHELCRSTERPEPSSDGYAAATVRFWGKHSPRARWVVSGGSICSLGSGR